MKVSEFSAQLKKLFNSGNMSFDCVDGKFKDIANSMTSYIRQSKNSRHKSTIGSLLFQDQIGGDSLRVQGTTNATGRVFGSEMCIDAHWRYFIFPAAMTAFTALFFFAVIAETTQKGQVQA